MADINLMQQQQPAGITVKRSRSGAMLVASAVIIIAVVVVYVGLLVYHGILDGDKSRLESSIASTDQEIAAKSSDREQAVQTQARFRQVTALASTRTQWTVIFAELEKKTLPDINYTSFNASPEGLISLSGIANNYQQVSQLLTSLRSSTVFSDVKLSGVQFSTDGDNHYTFNISFAFAPTSSAASTAGGAQ